MPRSKAQTRSSLSYDDAVAEAQKFLGPTGTVRFIKISGTKSGFWYNVGQLVDETDELGNERSVFGVVGQGKNWFEALDDARARVKAFRDREAAAYAAKAPQDDAKSLEDAKAKREAAKAYRAKRKAGSTNE